MKLTKLEELYAYAEDRGYPVIEPPKDGTIDSMAIVYDYSVGAAVSAQWIATAAEAEGNGDV